MSFVVLLNQDLLVKGKQRERERERERGICTSEEKHYSMRWLFWFFCTTTTTSCVLTQDTTTSTKSISQASSYPHLLYYVTRIYRRISQGKFLREINPHTYSSSVERESLFKKYQAKPRLTHTET